uniref:NPH3 domain-containing protein n=1 Tax=Oryza punctata TaxID=4537 RepID=A0A0E0KDP0_ORYPU
MGVATVTELRQSISGKRAFRPTLTNRHANEWPPTDVSSDLTVEVGTSSFALHKLLAQFPLVSRSGKIRRAVAEAKDGKLARLGLHGTPGGAAAFELAAKFCYGVGVDVTVGNVAMLRCAAHYLQMTEDFSDKNLELRAEAFLRDAVLPSIASSVAVLRSCEVLLPAAEDVNLVPRLIAAIANNVCKEQLTSGLGLGSGAMSPRDNYASVRRENRELKLEVARMRMRLTDLEKDHVSMKRELVRVSPANRLLRSFARRLNSLFFRMRPAGAEPGLQQLGAKATADAKVLFQRRRRHSIS